MKGKSETTALIVGFFGYLVLSTISLSLSFMQHIFQRDLQCLYLQMEIFRGKAI